MPAKRTFYFWGIHIQIFRYSDIVTGTRIKFLKCIVVILHMR